MHPKEQHAASVLKKVRRELDSSAKRITPWFFENMPDYYFLTHTPEEQAHHLNGIISGQVTTQGQTLTLRSPDHKRITYISPSSKGRELLDQLSRHIHSDVEACRFYSSKDNIMRLDTLLLAPQARADSKSKAFKHAAKTIRSYYKDAEWFKESEKEFLRFLAGATQDYVEKFEPERIIRHFRTLLLLEKSDAVQVQLEPLEENNESRIIISMLEPPQCGLLYQIVKILTREGVSVNRGYADSFRWAPKSGRNPYAIVSFYVSDDGKCLTRDCARWKHLKRELSLVKWLFAHHHLEVFSDENGWDLRRVMLLQAAAEFAHQFLIKQNLWAFTSDNIVSALIKYRTEATRLVEYFECRFKPRDTHAPEIAAAMEPEIEDMIKDVTHDVARAVLSTIFRFFKYTLRTNYFLSSVHGLSFRLGPEFLEAQPGVDEEELPYGFFFYHGPYAQGFHVRYRDMSRGGMRVVSTRNQEHFELESNRLFDEVTKLASAQQLKNKDIPEGGSKAVVLLGPDGNLDQSVKGMINSLLDLVLTSKDSPTLPGVTDYLGKEEILYLGPDEQITPEHITWAIDTARERGYRWPSAFMSSKPRAGINHKEYGVTSLGVIVFTHEILHYLGIDPTKDPFTVKLTGGPRGDVAGNAIKILFRDYGENAKVVAMTDGHGAAYDPDGLNHAELDRLIDEQLTIDNFNSELLRGIGAFVVSSDSHEGARMRNTLHNKAKADIFLPCGGRPDTMNIKNWNEFLTEAGEPSAKALVEGANIFISPEARTKLEKHDVLIVHGSSANKTGVICSSYEILGGLIMTDDEFLAIKKKYVAQVLDILRVRAAAEAKLMLREHRASSGKHALVAISRELSKEITAASDELYDILTKEHPSIKDDAELCELLMSYCPQILVEKYRDRILTHVPTRHLYALIAAFVASKIVYSMGVGWLKRLSDVRDLREVMHAFLTQEKCVAAHVATLKRSRLANKEEITYILENTGQKFLTKEALGLK